MMGGSAVYEEDWEITFPPNGVKTLVLVGRTGNGKSATGNTILGKQSFTSKTSCSGLTATSELQTTVLKDGQTLNVIDTPGLFDFEAGSEFIGKEIAKCIDLAKDGIHAVVVVFSVRTRFSEEEVSALQRLRALFGTRIVNYIIVVFTGGDGLKADETLDAYLGLKPPQPLKDFLALCDNRLVLFDNETNDETKRRKQVEDLLRLVDRVVEQNGGNPYTDELFVELKREATKRGKQEEDASRKGYSVQELTELKEQMDRSHEQQLTRITEMLESKLAKVEKQARVAQEKTNDQINELIENLSKAELAQKKSNDEIKRNLVLVGRTGNGKSATANSILGTKAFKSKTGFSGVTTTCELQSVLLQDGQILNVIDTPGLFDVSSGNEFIGKEIAKCIDLAKDGIHALLFVLKATDRFSGEDEAALKCLQTLFGSKIFNYMIVVFTGGDAFDDEEPFDDILDTECPKPLKDILRLCGNRFILFDNKTKDETKRAGQLEYLLSLVNSVLTQNSVQPFSDELFAELKRGATIRDQQEEVASQKCYTMLETLDLQEQKESMHERQIRLISEKVMAKLKELITSLERQLAEEKAVRMKAEEQFRSAQKESNDEICKLREDLENAQRKNQSKCSIL